MFSLKRSYILEIVPEIIVDKMLQCLYCFKKPGWGALEVQIKIRLASSWQILRPDKERVGIRHTVLCTFVSI